MKRNKLVTRILFVLFTAFMMVLTLNKMTLTVDALDYTAAEKVFEQYDGINNWKLQSNSPSNSYGTIPIGGNVSLGYAFGAVRDSNGTVTSGDHTITQHGEYTMVNGIPTVPYGKINIFLKYGDKYYGILHQGATSYVGGTPQTASDTSIDYALLTGGSNTSNYYSGMNLLTGLSTISSTTDKQFYTGVDANNKPVFKLLGYYSRRGVYVEIVLRPSITGAPIVQRELYVYNPNESNTSTQFQTYFGEDTGLDPNNNNNTVDNVPMFAIGGGEGLYLLSGKNPDGSNINPASKLFVTNDVKGGFKDFMGRILNNPSDWSFKGKESSHGADITDPKLTWSSTTQNGDTDAKAGTNLLISKNGNQVVNSGGLQDSAYTLRWPMTTLYGGQVAEFSSTIGATVAGYAIPIVSKTYTNLTSPGSTVNHVGDKLRFTLNVKNEGYQSSWAMTRILDKMPAGLTIDKSTTLSSIINGDNIDFNPNSSVGVGGSATFTFTATINNQAPYHLINGNLTNTAQFTGNNVNKNDPNTYTSSIDIPVEVPKFKYRFTKLVRNDTTDPNGNFESRTTGKKGDTIEYKVDFISNGTSTFNGANFADSLPDGLELVPGSVTMDGVTKDGLNFSVNQLSNDVTHTILFKAKVTGIDASTASNTAYFNNVVTSSGQLNSISTEAPAIVDIEAAPLTTSFVEVPTTIDFGSVNSAGLERTLPNVSTTGKLVVTHSADTPFQVSVSYDNNGDQPIASNGTKLIQDGGESLLFNQARSDADENWHSLTPDPVPIKSDGFSGSHTNYDLTDYIGAKKWKLRVPADSKAGSYSGQVTWSINDTI